MFPRDVNSFLLAREDGEDHDGRNGQARAVAVEERNSLTANSGAFLALLVDTRSRCGHGYLLGGDSLVRGGGDDMVGEVHGEVGGGGTPGAMEELAAWPSASVVPSTMRAGKGVNMIVMEQLGRVGRLLREANRLGQVTERQYQQIHFNGFSVLQQRAIKFLWFSAKTRNLDVLLLMTQNYDVI